MSRRPLTALPRDGTVVLLWSWCDIPRYMGQDYPLWYYLYCRYLYLTNSEFIGGGGEEDKIIIHGIYQRSLV